jgi:protein-S-isoprenylcysteine O-methyltransferase Ste14
MSDRAAAVVALALYGAWAVLAFGLRTVVQLRRTGDSGFRGAGGKAGSAEWWARILFVAALAIGLAAPLTTLAGLDRFGALDATAVTGFGIGVTVAGIVATLLTQLAMGESWRIGVDPDERTILVHTGPFRVVRNPIFTAMGVTAIGLALVVPNVVALAGLVLLVVALELQVRRIEEPYLLATHGASYRAYAARVGRFVPGVGRLRGAEPRAR